VEVFRDLCRIGWPIAKAVTVSFEQVYMARLRSVSDRVLVEAALSSRMELFDLSTLNRFVVFFSFST